MEIKNELNQLLKTVSQVENKKQLININFQEKKHEEIVSEKSLSMIIPKYEAAATINQFHNVEGRERKKLFHWM